jgi:hypothetical protein
MARFPFAFFGLGEWDRIAAELSSPPRVKLDGSLRHLRGETNGGRQEKLFLFRSELTADLPNG